MKIYCMPGKLSEEVSGEKYITQLVRSYGGDELAARLDIWAVEEAVKQRRSDALQIMELTLQATGALAAIE